MEERKIMSNLEKPVYVKSDEIRINIHKEEYKRLKENSQMLSQIASLVGRYAHTPKTTTYDCVLAMKERLRIQNKKVRDYKKQ